MAVCDRPAQPRLDASPQTRVTLPVPDRRHLPVRGAGFLALVNAKRLRNWAIDPLGCGYENYAPEPVVDAGLRALGRGRPVVVVGLTNRLLTTAARLSPGWVGAMVSLRR